MRIGILTGGGDCPGLNAVIRAVARRSFERGWDVVGIREGWHGLVDGITQSLGPQEISGIPPRGGTILGTTRTNPYRLENGVQKVLSHFEQAGLDAIVEMRECAELGIKRVWMHRGPGAGSVSETAEYGRGRGITLTGNVPKQV